MCDLDLLFMLLFYVINIHCQETIELTSLTEMNQIVSWKAIAKTKLQWKNALHLGPALTVKKKKKSSSGIAYK